MWAIAYFEGFVRNQAISECPPLLILKVLLDIKHFFSIFSFRRKHGSHSLGLRHRTVMRVKKNSSSTPVCPKVDKIFDHPSSSALGLALWAHKSDLERHAPNRLFKKGVGSSLLSFHFCLFSFFSSSFLLLLLLSLQIYSA